jgi:hypothetical protein
MSVYLHVTLELAANGVARFVGVMEEAVPILEAQGWRLHGAFLQRTGRLNTAIDVWELEDFGHFDRGLQGLIAHPRFPALKQGLDEAVLKETVVFADKAPFAH